MTEPFNPNDVDEAYIEPMDRLADVGQYLDEFDDPDYDGSPVMLAQPGNAGGDKVQAWLVHPSAYRELHRAHRFDQASRALAADPGNPALEADKRQSVQAMVQRAALEPIPGVRLVTPQAVATDRAVIARQIDEGNFKPVAIGRGGRPEAFLDATPHYVEMVNAHKAWLNSPERWATVELAPQPKTAQLSPELQQALGLSGDQGAGRHPGSRGGGPASRPRTHREM